MAKSNVKGVYHRKDGRWEARYKKGISEDGRVMYGALYGSSMEEVLERRRELLGDDFDDRKEPAKLNLLILGAGSFGKEVYDMVNRLHMFQDVKFLDDNVTGENVIGTCKEALKFKNQYPCAFVAIGDNEKRKKMAKFLRERNFLIPSIISQSANIASSAKIGEGVAVLHQCTVMSDAVIGDFCILASSSLVDSKVTMSDFSRLSPGAIVTKGAKVPEGLLIGDGEIYK